MSGSDLMALLGNVLASTADFQLEIGLMEHQPEYRGLLGYRLRNTRTGVVEQETNIYAIGIRTLHANQAFLEAVDADPAGEEVGRFEQDVLSGSPGGDGGTFLN